MSRGKREDRHRFIRGVVIGLLVVGLLYLVPELLGPAVRFGPFVLGLGLLLLGGALWIGGVKSTRCRFGGVTTGRPCENPADGVLRGCGGGQHKGLKLVALLERYNLPHWDPKHPPKQGELSLPDRLHTFPQMAAVLAADGLAVLLIAIGWLTY